MANSGRQTRRDRRGVVALVVLGLVAGACSSGDTSSTTTIASPTTVAADDTGDVTTTTTMTTTGTGTGTGTAAALVASSLRLSEGHPQQDPASPVPIVNGAPLDAAAIAALEARLPEWTVDDALAQPFAWPTQTTPAPRTGTTVDEVFPPADSFAPPEVQDGPLHVLRHQPDGDVAIAPFISITFDQSMVPVTTVGQLAAADVPVTISPTLDGRWQWIGTRTLRFDVAGDPAAGDLDRLPMATAYTVIVPAGTASATGGTLADDMTWTFTTPPVTVQSLSPSGTGLELVPVFVATFDQRIDPQAVLDTTTVTADGTAVALRRATVEEIAADPLASSITSNWPAGRWMAFRPVTAFAANAALQIDVGPNTPSAEGPGTADTVAHFSAHTYEPLRIDTVGCGYGPDCPPSTSIEITFDNELDLAVFDASTVTVDPPIRGMVVGASGNNISIRGDTAGRTTYAVTIPAGLTDVHGQHLAKDESRSITTGDAMPVLQQFSQPLITLDPLAAHPTISLVSTNHPTLHVRVFAVDPGDWTAFSDYALRQMQYDAKPEVPPFPELLDMNVTVEGDQDRSTETMLDLADAEAQHPGNLVVIVESSETYGPNSPEYWNNRPAMAWVQSTGLGVDAIADGAQLRAWVTDLATGAPRTGVTVQFAGETASAVTDADGLATLTLPANGAPALVATSGDETALLTAGYFGGAWGSSASMDQAIGYVIDDRGIYRPGETVSIKGWVRRLTTASGVDAQVVLVDDGAGVDWTAHDAQGNEIGSGGAVISPLGGFDFTFDIPAGTNLGPAWIDMIVTHMPAVGNASLNHQFQIEEFRRPEFEVTARQESTGPAVVGDPVTVAVDATYYAGGPLATAPVTWQVTTSPATYSPPGWHDFTFGRWTPWWYSGDVYRYDAPYVPYNGEDVCCGAPSNGSESATFTGTTDAAGTHYLQIDVPRLEGDLADEPVTVTAQASVDDVNRQSIASSTSVLVHPSSLYIGLGSTRTFVREGDPLDVNVIVTDVDGAAVAGRSLTVTASRTETVYRDGRWVDDQVDPQPCAITSATEPVTCHFDTTVGGTYSISADITDDAGRKNHSELTRWVTGGDAVPARTVTEETLTIVPDLAEYRPGDTAQLLVQSPIAEGDGLLVVTRNGIVSTTRFAVSGGSAVVAVPIADQDIPNLGVQMEVVGSSVRTADDGTPLSDAPRRPAFATGALTLPISSASRTLHVDVAPASPTAQPGDDTQVGVTVTGADGQPVVGAEMAVVVVDEAVLALSGYQLQDPLATFYGQLPTYLSTSYGRSSIVLNRPDQLGGGGPTDGFASADTASPAATDAPPAAVPTESDTAAGGEMATAGEQKSTSTAGAGGAIDVRTNFDALAVFEPKVITDAAGHATIDVPLPDNLTRYRVMVVAVVGNDHFGSGESNLTARLPLMVRPSAPRFLDFGDTIELPVVVQNQTDAAMDVDVVLQADNLDITGPAGVRVSVPANDRIEVRFPVAAALAGTARFRVSVSSGDAADSATVELPVYTPATAETFATYGVIDDGATVQPVVAPTDVIPQFGGLEVTTSSTSLQSLTDAVISLVDYPYRSSDALASRIIAIASLRDVLGAFDAAGLPTPAALSAAVQADVDALVALQDGEGGFPYWQSGMPADPYNTVQAAHALVIADQQGFDVPDQNLAMALQYLTDIESHIPAYYGQLDRDSINAYALNVRMLGGTRDSAKAKELFDRRGDALPLDALAWLWPVLDDAADGAAIERNIQNRAVDTAGAVTFTTDVNDDRYLVLASDRRTDGLVLDALIAMHPDSDLIPKVVSGLLGGRNAGHWDSVQENSFILLALHRYFETYEAQTPDFVAGVWLGGRLAGQHQFAGRSTDSSRISIPTDALIANGDGDLVIGKEGTGRLYYRIGLRTAPADLQLDPLDRGFVVSRSYEAVDDPADVTRDADGTWHVRAGARVRVRLTMVAESQRTHAALIDPLPAGLEILNPALATTADIPADIPADNGDGSVGGPIDGGGMTDSWYWYPTWFDHQNMRDDRAEAFATLLPAGTYDYTYVARATTPGTFVVPPVRAEEMYAPETFGRGSTDIFVVV